MALNLRSWLIIFALVVALVSQGFGIAIAANRYLVNQPTVPAFQSMNHTGMSGLACDDAALPQGLSTGSVPQGQGDCCDTDIQHCLTVHCLSLMAIVPGHLTSAGESPADNNIILLASRLPAPYLEPLYQPPIRR